MPTPYQKRVLEKRPVGYWRFEETSAPIAHDSTGHRRNGIYCGDVTFAETGAIRGGPDVAIGLDGLNAYIEVADDDAFSQPTSGAGLTVEAWFRSDILQFEGQTDAHYIHWMGKGQTGILEWGFRFYSLNSPRPNRVSAYIWNPTSETDETFSNLGAGAYFQDPIVAGAWIHVVACYDPGDADSSGAGVSIYKNGIFREGPSTSPGAQYSQFGIRPVHGTAPVRFGTRDLNSFLRGALDEVAIYPRVLTAEEILDNYNHA